jgi:hypothetical protein
MVRRLLCGAVIAGCAGIATLLAIERATFFLVDGERKSGRVVYHGGDRENLIAGDLNLGLDDGKEISIHEDQVSIIQFAGGDRPPRAELEALPTDNMHVLVRRDGATERGHFVNIIEGDNVKWRADNGDQRLIPIRDIARIYLKPDAARSTFDITGRSNNGAVATSGTVLEPGAVRVDANQQWSITGMNVRAGDLLAFRASGRIGFGQGPTQTAGPDGNDSLKSASYPVGAMPVGGLIGRVGNSAPFPIGSNTQPIRMPADGTLMLGVNDNEVGDNSGFFSVVITRQ